RRSSDLPRPHHCRGPRRAAPRADRAVATWLRHRARRRRRTLRRRAPTTHDRQGDPRRHPGADHGRGDRVRRPGVGAPGAAGPERPGGRSHRAGDRPPAAHRHRCRPHRGAGRWPHRRDRPTRGPARRRRTLRPAVARPFGRRHGPARGRRAHRGRRTMIRTMLHLLPTDHRSRVITYTVLVLASAVLRAAGTVVLVPLIAALVGATPAGALPWLGWFT